MTKKLLGLKITTHKRLPAALRKRGIAVKKKALEYFPVVVLEVQKVKRKPPSKKMVAFLLFMLAANFTFFCWQQYWINLHYEHKVYGRVRSDVRAILLREKIHDQNRIIETKDKNLEDLRRAEVRWQLDAGLLKAQNAALKKALVKTLRPLGLKPVVTTDGEVIIYRPKRGEE